MQRFDSILKSAASAGATTLGKYGEHFLMMVIDSGVKLDDDQAFLMSRSLELQWAKVIERKLADLPLATGTDFLPAAPPVDEGAKSYHYSLRDAQGRARWGAGRSRDGLPTSSVSGAEMTGRMQLIEGGLSFSREDMRNARFAGRPIEPALKGASLRAQVELWDEALAWGRESLALLGLFNHPNISIISASDIGGGVTSFRSKTIDQVLEDIAQLVNAIPTVTNELMHATKVLMSPRLGRYLRQKRLGGDNGKTTFWSQIIEVFTSGGADVPAPAFPVEFAEVRYLDASNTRSRGHLGNSDALFAYVHNDPDVAARVSSFLGRALPPEQNGFMTDVAVESKVGGIEVAQPLCLARMDGVFAG